MENEISEQQLLEELERLQADDTAPVYSSPQSQDKDSTLKFFRELIKSPESTKFGNLQGDELGKVKQSVRGNLNIALYAESQHLDELGQYFRKEAENTLASSLSNKGFLAQLFVTQIKKETKMQQHPYQHKKTWFGGSKIVPTEEGQQ